MSSYIKRRQKIRKAIFDTVNQSMFKVKVRGSWLYNDFHLDIIDDFTFSDLDLLTTSKLYVPKDEIISEIQYKLDNIINIQASIHDKDHFYCISLEESKIKNIYEYFISYKKYSGKSTNHLNYFKAKTLLLLLKRGEQNQRFIDVKNEMKDQIVDNLFNIKIGIENTINTLELDQLLLKHDDSILNNFLTNCIFSEPEQEYINKIQKLFYSCCTISDWLKSYISMKYECAT